VICDADAHVVEPPGLFADVAPPGLAMIDLPPTTPMVPCGNSEALADQLEHGFDAPSYLRAMDAQGIDAAVLYPSLGLFAPFLPELSAQQQAGACAAYADWVAAYCATDSTRLAAVGIAPLTDPARAVSEAQRARELGLVGLLARPNALFGRNLGDPAYDELYDVMADLELVLAVHEGLGVRGATVGADRFTTFAGRHVCSHPLEQMTAMASLVLDGALERHPKLKVAFLESGTGWLPYWLARLDEHIEWMADSETAGLRPATDYFARQCVISADPEDRLAAGTVAQVGADHVVWASDFPHPDAPFPNALDVFRSHSPDLTGPDLDAVLWDTPVTFYGLHDRFG
jgi:predicted TIM-barrel fold metal-dependent hydrolase